MRIPSTPTFLPQLVRSVTIITQRLAPISIPSANSAAPNWEGRNLTSYIVVVPSRAIAIWFSGKPPVSTVPSSPKPRLISVNASPSVLEPDATIPICKASPFQPLAEAFWWSSSVTTTLRYIASGLQTIIKLVVWSSGPDQVPPPILQILSLNHLL